MLNFNQLKIKR